MFLLIFVKLQADYMTMNLFLHNLFLISSLSSIIKWIRNKIIIPPLYLVMKLIKPLMKSETSYMMLKSIEKFKDRIKFFFQTSNSVQTKN